MAPRWPLPRTTPDRVSAGSGREPQSQPIRGSDMYIGIGTIVLIIVIVLLIQMMRGRRV